MSNSTRALIAGGGTPSSQNNIEFVTIATTGDAVDFGDLTRSTQVGQALSDSHGWLAQ